MFPISIQSSFEVDRIPSDPHRILDGICHGLESEGVSALYKVDTSVKFENRGMIIQSYKKFSLVSSGEFSLNSKNGKLFVKYNIVMWKILICIIPLALLSFGIIQAENITLLRKFELLIFFYAWFLGGSYLVTAFRLRRWLAACVDSVSLGG